MTRVDSAVACHCTSGVSQGKGLSGQASQSHRLRKGVADLEMRSASTVHGLLQRSDDDTTSNNTKEGQPTDFLNLPPPPLRAANRRRPPQAKLKKVGTCYCNPYPKLLSLRTLFVQSGVQGDNDTILYDKKRGQSEEMFNSQRCIHNK